MVLRFWFRKDWGAKYWSKKLKPLLKPLYHPVQFVLLYYRSYYKTCRKDLTCKRAMKCIQKRHIQKFNFPDIAYNFCIGGDGVVYEGRGWVTLPQYMDLSYKEYNGNSIDIAYIGDFREGAPDYMNMAVHELIEFGVEFGYISPDYEVKELTKLVKN
ncbi:peptidoglycan-recognition protein 3-like [Macrosteles quadrilineatus]|uniref:peptidoglycan-recognition protein 3-like n=1 Tax=Macrosteles quadrilineatus TaxID=74068 RepID=UPI0023E0C8FF|nr:peptidoglycan-recognition protein 3-like [Macrosteles quadrilineatus]